MIRHRCPWCGERIPFHLQMGPLLWKPVGPDVCPKCKKPYTPYRSRNRVIVLTAAVAGIYLIIYLIKSLINNGILYWLFGIAGLILLALVFVELCRIPYARDIKKEERRSTVPKHTADVDLFWEKHKKGGLLLPRFRVLAGEIFPACFMDADGTPVSTALCVVLTDFVWSDHLHCSCKIHFVLDDAPEERLFSKENQFYLYDNHRKIAKGTVK